MRVLSTGSRRPYTNLLTKMKSPSSSVGIIESEGMRKGSNRNERISSTSRMTGKNERAYSTDDRLRRACGRRAAACSTHASSAQIAPVRNVSNDQNQREVENHSYTSRKTARSILDFC